MTKKKILMIMALAFSLLFFAAAGIGFAKEPVAKDIPQVTIKGKIGYLESFGGYYVASENPPSELFIVNKNQRVLEKLKNSGKIVTIKGRLTIGADHLMIDKINGKNYSVEKPQ